MNLQKEIELTDPNENELNEEENLYQPQFEKTFKYHLDTVSQIVFNPNNKEIISSSFDNTVLLWDLANNQAKPKKLTGHKSLINEIAVSPTGLLIASASSDETVRIWKNNQSQSIEYQVLKHNSTPVKTVDFSCDSRLIVTGSDDKTVKIINVGDRKLVANLNSHSNWIKSVRFSFDAKLIASASDDRTVKLWDSNKKIELSSFTHTGVVNSVRFHPDNSLIGTACFDKKIRLFDIRSKQLVQAYDQHKKPVTSIAFHPSGNFMVSTSYDETIKIFDLRNGQIMFTLTGHECVTNCVNFSKYGDYFCTGGADGLVILWKSNFEKLLNPKPSCEYYNFPIENDVKPASQYSSSVFSKHSSKKNINSKSEINDIECSPSEENISEELSKVFEKMVYQLELVTKLTKLEDRIDEIKSQTDNNIKFTELSNQMQQMKHEINYQSSKFNELRNKNITGYSQSDILKNFENFSYDNI